MTDILCRGLCKAYGGLTVLNNFSCRFEKGKINCLMGPSGAGKTTLLRLMAGLETADRGTVEGLAGQRISVVFQEDRLWEPGSAVDNIRLACGRHVNEAGMMALLSRLQIEDAARRPVRLLSGGMRRRVALIRALLFPWDVLLLDEPFQGLDAETKRRAIDEILSFSKGKTVIAITHSLEDAKAMGAQVLDFSSLNI